MTNQKNPFTPGTLAQKIMDGDWSDMTLEEIAKEFNSEDGIISATMRYIREKTGIVIPYRKRPKHKPDGAARKKPDPKATAQERHTALVLEAKRRGISYGALANDISFVEEERIVAAYLVQKKAAVKRKTQNCKGCVWRKNGSCSFHDDPHNQGRLRRKDKDGLCLEYTARKRRRILDGG